jgi:hypothetical protein
MLVSMGVVRYRKLETYLARLKQDKGQIENKGVYIITLNVEPGLQRPTQKHDDFYELFTSSYNAGKTLVMYFRDCGDIGAKQTQPPVTELSKKISSVCKDLGLRIL